MKIQATILILLVALLGLGLFIWIKPYGTLKQTTNTSPGSTEISLPTVDTLDKLKTLIATTPQNFRSMGEAFGGAPSAKGASPQVAAADASQTNVQVQGVDEGDIVKTDGNYIYQINRQKVLIIQAQPANNLKVSSRLNFEQNFFPRDMYVDDQKLVIIGTYNTYVTPQKGSVSGATPNEIMPSIAIAPTSMMVKAIVYDISNKANPKQIRQVELTGNYLSSRKIGSTLYLVANKYADVYRIMNKLPENPGYRDSKFNDKLKSIDYQDIRYFPESVEPSYVLIGRVDLDTAKEMQVSTYLGAGQNIYSSINNLYVAVSQWEQVKQPLLGGNSQSTFVPPKSTTAIYKFNLEKGQISLSSKGEVPGTILNQFSMDESEGYFRIATTKQDQDGNSFVNKNNLYILDSNLKANGKLENLAPGERIYSVRFMGNRGYMVTFKNVDPLFVLDLHDPKDPKVLGTLKIPGFSSYLHPYDENHIIGFGQDTAEIQDNYGNNRALTQGIKLALFDVSDVANPKEEFKEIIGGRGSYSELLNNHKALLFSKEKNIMAFPITVTSGVPQNNKLGAAGDIAYQGAYVYSLDQTKGFVFKGRITHLTQEDFAKGTVNWGNFAERQVERVLYINNTLFTISKEELKANDLSSLTEIGALSLK